MVERVSTHHPFMECVPCSQAPHTVLVACSVKVLTFTNGNCTPGRQSMVVDWKRQKLWHRGNCFSPDFICATDWIRQI